MAWFDCHFYSEVLGLATTMYVLLPQRSGLQIGNEIGNNQDKHPVLYLLHGLSDDHTAWMRYSLIERYASEAGLAIVMPAVNRSYYTDMLHGGKYWTFISEELPRLVRSFFPISADRGQNYVAGLSMGGYGAIKLAMSCPDRFAAGASLSGALDLEDGYRQGIPDFPLIFGPAEGIPGSKHDLFANAARLVEINGLIPRLYICCGTEDKMYGQTVRFRDHCYRLGLPLTYAEGPGAHNWDYWNQSIKDVLSWLPLQQPLGNTDLSSGEQ
ncbi:S-formylglutathione hydrolase FrmB [Paenibacillus sp. UNCCL117]|uniref:alpha/beta hydrolase n=1 Tax=unclassified Paenibacillus TaxID=185978 RepID=UPI00088D843C|nr:MULTISPECIES: alpha/beta hydrolase family protein [unclassified Paenibacillus]SDC56121.1 S-formylglutathione hydrolase FrmB [Paenibacillus sp. cl123]SFW10850.1 S-formylglutathione hydrolase FrmB [Paenibacillus sp. UNCCL117]